MRDIFTNDAGKPANPMEAAQRAARPNLRARFYKSAKVGAAGEGGFPILLDGRPVRTPARAPLAAPSRELAQALVDEWDARRDVVDPARMPLTRLANAIIDGVVKNPGPVAAEIEKYLGSDLLFYRAGEPEGLVAGQAKYWDPILQWARETFGAHFVLTEGITFAAQPAEAVAAAAKAIPRDPWRLGAVNSATALTGSALLGLALAAGRLDADAAWAAAHVDEDWNMAQWGRDEQALKRRAERFAEMQAAAQVLSLTKESS
jgi:chaperone required for assembly of F1-ATPase